MQRSVSSKGFSEDEFVDLIREPEINKLLTDLARERYPRQRHIALDCLRAGFSLAIRASGTNSKGPVGRPVRKEKQE